MKDFMLVFLGINYAEMGLSPEEIQGQAGKWMEWQEKMSKQGILKEGNALSGGGKRVSGPNRTVSDRASADLKEYIGGYYIVTAEDYDKAIEVAQDYPDYDIEGTVEIREVFHFS